MQFGLISGSTVFPGRNIRKMFIIALCFSVRSLVFLAEMAAAGFVSMPRIDAHQLAKLKKVGDSTCLFQALVQVIPNARDIHVLPVLLTQFADFLNGMFKALGSAGHTADRKSVV